MSTTSFCGIYLQQNPQRNIFYRLFVLNQSSYEQMVSETNSKCFTRFYVLHFVLKKLFYKIKL